MSMLRDFLGQSLLDNIGFGQTYEEDMQNDGRLTDAVIAAVRTMNALDKSPTGIMGGAGDPTKDEIAQIDRLVHATNKDFLAAKERLDPAMLVRFGLFANDWLVFLEEMKTLAELQALSAKRLVMYRNQAISWAKEASKLSGGSVAKAGGSEFSWKKFFVVTGIVFACIIGIVVFVRKKDDPEIDEGDLEPYSPYPPRQESGTVVINVQGQPSIGPQSVGPQSVGPQTTLQNVSN